MKKLFVLTASVLLVLFSVSCKNRLVGGGCCNGSAFEVVISLTDFEDNSLKPEELKSLRITEIGIKENDKKYWKTDSDGSCIRIENGESQLRFGMSYFHRDFHTDEEKLKDTCIIIESILCKFQKTLIPNLAEHGYIKEKNGKKRVYKFKLKLNKR